VEEQRVSRRLEMSRTIHFRRSYSINQFTELDAYTRRSYSDEITIFIRLL
jgi:hypothetical protein